MSICDRINDRDLELIASALHKFTQAISRLGLDPAMHLTPDEVGACVTLAGLCPAGPMDVNGDTDEERP